MVFCCCSLSTSRFHVQHDALLHRRSVASSQKKSITVVTCGYLSYCQIPVSLSSLVIVKVWEPKFSSKLEPNPKCPEYISARILPSTRTCLCHALKQQCVVLFRYEHAWLTLNRERWTAVNAQKYGLSCGLYPRGYTHSQPECLSISQP